MEHYECLLLQIFGRRETCPAEKGGFPLPNSLCNLSILSLITYGMTSITIQLDDRTSRRLVELSRREHAKPEEVVTDALRRRLFLDWFDATSERVARRAKERGFEKEEDFLNAVS